MVDSTEDLMAARWRLARAYAAKTAYIADLLEREPEARIPVELGLSCVEMWEKFCKADQAYRKAKEKEESNDE